MGRTNIDIDDELVDRAMRLFQLPSKRAAVDFALRRLVEPMDPDEVLAMEGVGWGGDLDALRRGWGPASGDRADEPERTG